MENYSKHKNDGTVNPVREGETLVQVWQRNGMTSPGHFCSPAANLIWRECGDDTITDYAVSPPRFVDWSKPLVTNMGTTPRGVLGPDNSGCYDVTGDFGEGVEKRYFNADGSHAFGKPIYVRNAPEAADKPDMAATTLPASHVFPFTPHATPCPAIAALDARLAELDADRERIMRAMRILRGEG